MTDNMIVRVLTRIFDFIVLNIVWLVCSLPVITIGASTTALYKVMLKIVKNEEGYILRDYFKAWKDNFKQSTIISIFLLIVGGILAIDFAIVNRLPGIVRQAGIILWGAIFIFYIIEVIFVFPLIAQFENTTKNMIKNAFLIPVSRLPYALLVILMTGMCLAVTLLNGKTMMAGTVIWSFIGVSALTYANSYIIEKIFEPYAGE